MGEIWLKRWLIEMARAAENQMKVLNLRERQVEQKRVAVVSFGMEERYGNRLRGGRVNSFPNLMMVTNRKKA